MTNGRTTSKVIRRDDGPTKAVLINIRELSPAYFGMVMATGIVSLAAHMSGLTRIAGALFCLNIACYAWLWLLTLLRMVRFPARFFGDMIDHQRGPGFLTTVAATGILGSQFVIVAGAIGVGKVLWLITLILWIGLTYTIFAAFTVKENKPTLDGESVAPGCSPWSPRSLLPCSVHCSPYMRASRTDWSSISLRCRCGCGEACFTSG